MGDHDRLLSGRLNARYGPDARRRAANALALAMSEALSRATMDAAEAASLEDDASELALQGGLDAYRLIRAIRDELLGV